ncbi:CHRD domain-containing protein [Piscinibacter terrae]|uniref:CHRD domain-containing protein n=1 Tax=Piscinibacter terrae TaxID=2496871 RepID=A0A3N7JWR9_9BURK|nr:CHRD domain-containing protein [Albitalea terrae]RQP23315.1 CHRD domain-containing protein [Albitalea terrae]
MRSSALIAAALGAATAMPAAAVTTIYVATLNGASEVIPNASPGTGTARVTVDSVLHTMRVESSFAGLAGGNTAAHIHCCTATPDTGAAGVATTTPTFTGFPSGTTSGTYDHTFDMDLASSWNGSFITAHGGTTAGAFAFFASGLDAGTTYFNIHTTAFPGGEIRGFLHAVPEPETYALMLVGLGLVGWTASRRRRV